MNLWSVRAVTKVSTALIALSLLSGCDYLGVEPASKAAAQREQEGKAVGGACRHAGRAIEDCYAYNDGISRAAIFEGWREMNDYMVQNKIEIVKPETTPQLAKHEEVITGSESASVEAASETGSETANEDAHPPAKTAALLPTDKKRGQPKPLGENPVLSDKALSKSAEKTESESHAE